MAGHLAEREGVLCLKIRGGSLGNRHYEGRSRITSAAPPVSVF